MKIITNLDNIFNKIVDTMAWIGGLILVLAMLSINLEIVMRYFFNRPQIWVNELTSESLLFITFLGAAWVLRNDSHVNVDMLIAQLNQRTQIIINIITSFIAVILFFIITWISASVTWQQYQGGYYNPTFLEIPSAFILFIIPVGSFVLFIQLIKRTIGYIKLLKGLKKSH